MPSESIKLATLRLPCLKEVSGELLEFPHFISSAGKAKGYEQTVILLADHCYYLGY